MQAVTRRRGRAAAWVAGLAIWLGLTATTLAPPPVDEAMVERAIAGAEWLAARAAKATLEQREEGSAASDMVNWLLDVGAPSDVAYDEFAAHLAKSGYGDPLFAIQTWLEEISNVLAAAEAARRWPELRSVQEIQVEIRTLPTVPLDEAGRAERDRLMDELILAATPEDDRRAAARVRDRIAALQALFERESRK